jgi:hypothetical protein
MSRELYEGWSTEQLAVAQAQGAALERTALEEKYADPLPQGESRPATKESLSLLLKPRPPTLEVLKGGRAPAHDEEPSDA